MFDVSIIIPSHNRYPLNLISLYALEKQTFNLSKMEVILVDDASTDNTSELKNYNPPYSFKYIRNKNKLGVSCTRNIGLNLAQGKIIIFLDAEMIVGPDYVSRHYQHHLNHKENVVVVGINKSRAFTFLFPSFNKRQRNIITWLFKNRPVVKERWQKRLTKKKVMVTEIQPFIRNLKNPVQLIDQHEITNLPLLHSFSKKVNNPLVRYFQNCPDNCYVAWMACFGSNHSFPRSLIGKIGGYDEEFKLWGMEDVEFGYRLYKAGAKFIIDPNISRYHQEHPSTGNKDQNNIINTILFEKKHPSIDACIRSLLIININDFCFFNNVIREHNLLLNKFSTQFREFDRSVVLLLKQIPILKLQKKETFNLLNISGIEKDKIRKQRLFSERNRIAGLGKYNNLVRLFDMLVSL